MQPYVPLKKDPVEVCPWLTGAVVFGQRDLQGIGRGARNGDALGQGARGSMRDWVLKPMTAVCALAPLLVLGMSVAADEPLPKKEAASESRPVEHGALTDWLDRVDEHTRHTRLPAIMVA